jgi:WD40 repeat protein
MMTLQGHAGRVRGLAYTPDGSTLASCGADAMVRLWDRATGRPIRSLKGDLGRSANYRYEVFGVAISPGGDWLASASQSGQLLLWSLAGSPPDDMVPRVLRARDLSDVGAVAFVDDGNLVFGGWSGQWHEAQGHAVHWDLATGASRVVALGLFAVWSVAIHPTSGTPALGVRAGRGDEVGVFLWDPGSDLRPDSLSPGPPASHVRSLAYSPDGRWLAASQKDKVAIWDAESLRLETTLRGHSAAVQGVAYAPGGSVLASASHDGTVRLWDAEAGEPRGCFDWEIGRVDCVAFAPDGMTVAAGGEGKIVVWDVEG